MPAKTKAKPVSLAVPLSGVVRTFPPAKSVEIRPVQEPYKNLLWIALLLGAATLALYSSVIRHPFVNYDDVDYVVENAQVRAGLTWATVSWALRSTQHSNWHPLTWISHALDCQVFGLNAGGHHFSSLLLHVFNSLLIFVLLARATGAKWRSLLVAALFALHPINVESVAWVAERKNVLSMFFLLWTLAAYGWYARRPGIGRYLAVTVLFILGLASKPMVVTLPFLLLLLDVWPLQRARSWSTPSLVFPVPQASLKWLFVEKLPLFALSAASSVITMVAQKNSIIPVQNLPLGLRLQNATLAYASYVWKACWPSSLAAFYPLQASRLAASLVGLAAIFLIVITFPVWKHRSRPYLIVGWLWFLGSLVPMIGLVQVGEQSMADRYAYLPLLGLFVMAVWGLSDMAEKKEVSPVPRTATAVVVLLFLSFLTWRQIGFWGSSYDLWSHTLQVTQNNYVAEDFAGEALLVDGFLNSASHQRRSDEALAHFRNAVRINPQDPISHLNLGADYHERGNLQQAIAEYRVVPNLTRDPYLLGKVYLDLGDAYHQIGDFRLAQENYDQALQIDPRNPDAFGKLGDLARDQMIVRLTQQDETQPTAKLSFQLGQLLQVAGRVPEARARYEESLKLDSRFGPANLALQSLNDLKK